MSAVRNSTNRAEARKKRALPYSRTIVRTILRVFGYGEEEEDQPGPPADVRPHDQPVADRTAPNVPSRPQDHAFRAESNQSTFSNRQPLAQMDLSNLTPRRAMDPPSSFAVPDTRSVANYFSQKTGTPVGVDDVESMVATFQVTPENFTPFRFQHTPGPQSSPLPSNPNFTPTSAARTPSSKKLSRNTNGTYKWEGAGSAKHTRPRNRYASPAFGVSPSKPERLAMKESNGTGETDHKRRRVDESGPSTSRLAAESSDPSVLPFPLNGSPTPPPRGNTPPARSATVSSSARLRTPAKPTAPVVPSPLRQAWSDASPGSPREEAKRSPTRQLKPTQTANFMAELIKETTPPKRPDLSNPYQAASPVGKVGPPRRGTKRARATGRPALPAKEVQAEQEEKKQKEKEKLEDYSPQAIIEATVPKGSKRSRPPAHFQKSISGSNFTHESSVDVGKQYTVEEPEDDESNRSTKKSKPTLNGNGRPSTFSAKASPPPPEANIRIEVIEDVPEGYKDQEKIKVNGAETAKPVNGSANVFAAAANTNGSTSRSSFSALKSIPREPSKLRWSFQADAPPSPAVVPASLPQPTTPAAAPTPLPKPTPAAAPKPFTQAKPFTPPSGEFNFSFKANDEENAKTPEKFVQLQEDTHEAKPLTTEEIKSQVGTVDATSLPTFTFTFTGASELPSTPDHVRVRGNVKVLPPSSLPTFEFAKSTVDSSSGFKFGLTPSKTASSYTYHDAPKPSTLPSLPAEAPKSAAPAVKGFDFAAAGFRPINTDTWTCSVCLVSNPNTSTQCVACQEDRKD